MAGAHDLLLVIADRDDPSKTHELTGWLSYTVTDDIRAGVPHFTAALEPSLLHRKLIGPGGQKCWVYQDGAFQFAGILDENERDASMTASDLHVSGRGLAGQLMDSDIEPDRLSLAGLTLEQIAKRWIEPFGDLIPGVTINFAASRYIAAGGDGSSGGSGSSGQWDPAGLRKTPKEYKLIEGRASGPAKPAGKSSPYYRGLDREPIRQTRMDPGTKVWEGLVFLAKQVGAHVWSCCDGTVVIGRPSYDSSPKDCYGEGLQVVWDPYARRYVSNLVKGSRVGTTCAERASEYLLVGTAKPNKKAKGAAVVKNWKSVKDPAQAFWKRQATPPYLVGPPKLYRPRLIDVKGLVDPKLIRRIAMRTMEDTALSGISIEYRVGGHRGPGPGLLWTIDTLVDVQDDEQQLWGPFYIAKRAFSFDSQGAGRETTLTLLPPDVWLPNFDPDAISEDAYNRHMMHAIWW